MTIFITIEELEPEYQKMGYIHDPHIDYATNAIHAWLGEKEVIIFRFKDYGWVNDNRYNSYNLTIEPNGILIHIFIRNGNTS